MNFGVQRSGQGVDAATFSLGESTLVPLHRSAESMAWHATFPGGSVVPAHVHRTQDEFLYILSGTLHVQSGNAGLEARPGDLVRLPIGEPHRLHNRGADPVTCVSWVIPTRGTWDFFSAASGLTDRAEIRRIAAQFEIEFLPAAPG